MRPATLLVLASFLPSCVFHVHVHEAPRTAVERSDAPAPRPDAAGRRTVSGVVVDPAGRPVSARVAAVGEGGSFSRGTSPDGRFEFDLSEARWATALHASTEDGLIAVAPIGPGGDTRLVLAPGSKLVLDLDGRPSARCAVFSRDLRVEDFTLRSGTTATVVVPAGGVHLRVYEGEKVLAESQVELATGESRWIRLAVGG